MHVGLDHYSYRRDIYTHTHSLSYSSYITLALISHHHYNYYRHANRSRKKLLLASDAWFRTLRRTKSSIMWRSLKPLCPTSSVVDCTCSRPVSLQIWSKLYVSIMLARRKRRRREMHSHWKHHRMRSVWNKTSFVHWLVQDDSLSTSRETFGGNSRRLGR